MTNASETTPRGYRWLLSHWYLPFYAAAATVVWAVRATKETPTQAVRNELDAINERAQVRKVKIERGNDLANAIVTAEYYRTLQMLSADQKRKVDAMAGDPVRRVRYLRQLSKRMAK